MLEKWRRGQNYVKKDSDCSAKYHLQWGDGESTNQKVAPESIRKLLWKLLGKVLRKVLGKWWRGQNYLRKTVIGGNVAFRMG